MMKKILSITLVLLLCLSMLAACGEDNSGSNNDSGSTTTTTTGAGTSSVTATEVKTWLIATYQKGDSREAMVIKADMEVLTVYKGLDIVWSVSVTEGDENAVKISAGSADNKAIIDIADEITAAVAFTAIASITDAEGNTEKAEFLFAIPGPVADPAADSTLTLVEAIELGSSKSHDQYTTNKYYIVVTVVEITNAQYGNMKVKDEEGNTLTIYGSYGPDGKDIQFSELNPAVKSGDKVKLYGIIGQYNDTPQMKNAWIKEINGKKPGKAPTTTRPSSTVKEPAANSDVSIADAIEIGMAKEHNVYTANKYYITGVVTEVYNSEYGNMKIKDDKGNILTVYGSYSADGNYGFSALKTQPKAGDTIKVYGIIGQYNNTPQIKNAWIITINGKTPEVNASASVVPTATMVTAPKVGVAYKFGLEQTAKGAIYYFVGTMSGYYGATETDVSLAVDVYLENADGGYKIYFKDASGAKKYIKLEQSGTHYNFTFGAEGSVFTWDATKNSLYAPCGDATCYMGTYGNYVTFGCLTTEKLKDGDYVAHFYTVD